MLSLLSVCPNNFAMELFKPLGKALRQIYGKVEGDTSKGQTNKPLPAIPQHKSLVEYQRTQKQNVNGFLFSLFAAGAFKYGANQHHPAGDSYFNLSMASAASLGVSATFAYKLFTTPAPKVNSGK